MEPRPIRMPDQLWEAIESDAAEHDRMAAEHVREICREHLDAETEALRKQVASLEKRVDDLEDLERRVALIESEILESETEPSEAAGERSDETAEATAAESRTAETAETERGPEPVESIEDVVRRVSHERGGDEAIARAGRAALEALRDSGRMETAVLRRELVDRYAPDDEPAEVWWSTTVQPVLETAAKWGLVVVHDAEFEWIGPPEGGTGR